MKKLVCCLTAVVFSLGLAACAAAEEQPAPEVTPQIVVAETSAPSVSEAPAQDVIVFNDSVLEGLVREAMRKPEGDITAADALGVTELDMQMQGVDPDQPYIHNLDALRYFTNLTYLGLGYAVQNADNPYAPVDLSPLAGLSKLESLQLGGLVIDDLSIVANMPNLQSLTVFGGKHLSDLSPLAGLTNLQALTLNNNFISDVSPLAGLTNLIYLDLQGNLISDVAPLAGLTKLERFYIADNLITDYSPLAQIRANLKEWDFEAVNQPAQIEFRDAAFEQAVRDVLGIPEGTLTLDVTRDVTELDLRYTGPDPVLGDLSIQNIDAIKYFPNLTKLLLSDNAISRIDGLRALPKLAYLDLSGNPVVDITPLAACKMLTALYLPQAEAGATTDYSALAGIYPNLTEKNFDLPQG